MSITKTRSSSLARRVCAYLKSNPEEVLTRTDIGTKFEIAPSAVDSLLATAVGRGELVCTRNDDDGLVWRLGGLPTSSPAPFALGERAAKSLRQQRLQVVMSLDLDAIPIEKDVFFEEKPSRRDQWSRLFTSMSDVGDSFAVPVEARNVLYNAACDYKKASPSFRFAIRVVNDTHCRIWRRA